MSAMTIIVNLLLLAAMSVMGVATIFLPILLIDRCVYLICKCVGCFDKPFQMFPNGEVYLISVDGLFYRENGEVVEFRCKRDAQAQIKLLRKDESSFDRSQLIKIYTS